MSPRVLVREDVGEPGLALLREHFEVETGFDWTLDELAERIGGYEAILIRSATKLTAELIDRGERLVVIARAGVGVDNVDVAAATRRGIVVANAPQSNVVTAAEHTMALLLALARNIPQAHASLTSGRWERSKFSGVELYEKRLGILGFGRIGQLVAARARGFAMRVIAFDPLVSAERYRELGVERAASADEVYARADFLSVHLPITDETRGIIDAAAIAKMRDGVRILNVARGGLIDDDALQAALDSGKVAGAALDVFPSEPITDYPLFDGYDNVVVTPHLGASTAEATDRAGLQSAEQIVLALTGGAVTTAVNIPSIGPEAMAALTPFLPLAEQLGRLAMGLAQGSSIERIETSFLGRIAEMDTRLLTLAAITGAMQGRTEQAVNYVNAAAFAAERGIVVEEKTSRETQDFNELIRVSVHAGGERVSVAGTGVGPGHVPHLAEVWDQRFMVELERNVSVFRYRDVPGMIGHLGTVFGANGINISAAAVGRQGDGAGDGSGLAAMVVMTDGAVPDAVVAQVLASAGFVSGRSDARMNPLEPLARREAESFARHDPLWPAQVTVAAAIALSLDLPSSLTIRQVWLIPAIEGALLLGLVATTPWAPALRHHHRRKVALVLVGLVSLSNLVNLGLLVHVVLHGRELSGSNAGSELVVAGAEIWITNILLFTVFYWELDRGGPFGRRRTVLPRPDFLFPQMTEAALGGIDWCGSYIDYLYTSFTNATAFSPTDTMPLSPAAKLLMLVQSGASLVTIGMVFARAINILTG